MAKEVFILNETDNVANSFIAELRDIHVQSDRLRFRKNLSRLGQILAYELSKRLEYATQEVETPLGIAKENVIKDQLVLATIMRAGIPFHHGFLEIFDKAENAFVSAYRRHHRDGTFEIKLEYQSCPSIEGKVLVLVDPMLATGASMKVALETILSNGKPKSVHIATAIASALGLSYIERLFPDATLWVGAVDEELTAKSYIVPGLGDAGDLAYGSKLQE